MRGWLDYCMRRKGWFLLFLVIFVISGCLGYQGLVAWHVLQATDGEVNSTAQVEIEVPHTGLTTDESKHPEDGLVSAYSSGKTTTTEDQAQVGTFPFDFGRDLRPGTNAIVEATTTSKNPVREMVRTAAKWIFTGSVLALALHVISDRYWR